MPEPFFGFESYHVMLAVAGGIVILARWLPRFVSSREPVAPPLLILFGMIAALLVPGLPLAPDPRVLPRPWEIASELTIIVALFTAGLRIDRLGPWLRWVPTARMLFVAMPLTIAAVAFLGAGIAGMTVAGAILLGAVLAPTDPVLAGDVQVGPPQEGEEHRVRFALTTEAALNDGLAFPFVYLGLLVAAQGLNPSAWLFDWLAVDVIYRIVVGVLMGAGGGWVLGRLLFHFPRRSALAETTSGVIALAGVLLCYGSTELVEGYGFISVAVMGLTLRRVESAHQFHRRLHDFCENIEHAMLALLLIALGMVLPRLFTDLEWSHVFIALALVAIVRPAAGWISLAGSHLSGWDRGIVAVYGVRGIGSIYYLCYAGRHMEFVNETQLWSLVALAIVISTVLHGFSVARALDRVRG